MKLSLMTSIKANIQLVCEIFQLKHSTASSDSIATIRNKRTSAIRTTIEMMAQELGVGVWVQLQKP